MNWRLCSKIQRSNDGTLLGSRELDDNLLIPILGYKITSREMKDGLVGTPTAPRESSSLSGGYDPISHLWTIFKRNGTRSMATTHSCHGPWPGANRRAHLLRTSHKATSSTFMGRTGCYLHQWIRAASNTQRIKARRRSALVFHQPQAPGMSRHPSRSASHKGLLHDADENTKATSASEDCEAPLVDSATFRWSRKGIYRRHVDSSGALDRTYSQ